MNYPDIVGLDEQVAGLRPGQQVNLQPQLIARTLFASADEKTIQPGATESFQIQLQTPLRLEQLVIVSSFGPQTTAQITTLKVGPDSQIVSNSGSLPVAGFAPTAFGSNTLRGNTAPPGVDIVLQIKLPATAQQAETFQVYVKGTALTR